jgi:hypothetical protein
MHIIFITSELLPYVEKTALAKDLVSFARSLKALGHQVSAVIPSIKDVNLSAHSLARRLSGVSVSVDEESFTAARYDGRTSDGVTTFFLDVPNLGSSKDSPTSAAAAASAASLVASLAEAPDVCISFGVGLCGFSAAARRHPSLATTVLLANLFDAKDDEYLSAKDADRVVVPRRGLLFEDADTALRAAVIPDAVEQAEVNDKPSRKTAFQMKTMLKVRSDVPLVLFCDFAVDALADYLASDVQALVFDDRADCLLLKERYLDRLRVISKADLSAALEASDGCVVCDEKHLVSDCLTRGTIPIVSSSLKDEVVDLESNLASGTGIAVSSRDAAQLTLGLSRFVALFHTRQAFGDLVSRLPSYAMTWQRVAAYTLGLIEEVITENR